MAGRNEKHTVDYFPFYVKDGKTLFILESKYGCKGTGFFTNVMRFLCLTPDHHYCISNVRNADRLYFFSKLHCDEESGMDMLNIMAETEKINKDLWLKHQIIYSEDLVASLSEAYRNRKNKPLSFNEITLFYQLPTEEIEKPAEEIRGNEETDVKNTQIKENKIKEKKRKYNAPEFILPEFIPRETWNAYLELRKKKRAAETVYAFNLIIAELQKIKETHNHDPVAVLNQSIKSGWIDVYPLKSGGNNGNGTRNTGSEQKTFGKTGAKSDGEQWPEDHVY